MYTMNKITAKAVASSGSLSAPDRNVTTGPSGSTVELHGQTILTINPDRVVVLNGNARPTRKTTRLLNTILEELGQPERVKTSSGRWFIDDNKRLFEFTALNWACTKPQVNN